VVIAANKAAEKTLDDIPDVLRARECPGMTGRQTLEKLARESELCQM